MKNKSKGLRIEGILVLLLFCVFAVLTLVVLLIGVGAYQRMVQRGQETYINRTIPQYISTKVRQADGNGAISLGTMDGIQTLELLEEIEGVRYITQIYCYDGYLRELFAAETVECQPIDGTCILEAENIHFALEGNELLIVINKGYEKERTVNLMLRSEGEWPYEE